MNPFYQKIGIFLHFFLKPVVYFRLNKSIRVRVIICYQDQILLTKTWLSNGKWSLPGGGTKDQEDLTQTALREIQEETGVKLNASSLVALPDYLQKYLKFCIIQKIFKVNLKYRPVIQRQLYEISDIGWIKIQELNNSNTSIPTLDILSQLSN